MNARQATTAHTQLGAAWLWTARDCRVIADEAGFGCRESLPAIFCPPLGVSWRADLVGVRWHMPRNARRYGEGSALFDLVEVKGHRADWLREKPLDPNSKWQLGQYTTVRLWLLVSATIGDDLLVDVPPWWGIVRADTDVQKLVTVRTAPQSGRIDDAGTAAYSLHALARRSVTGRLPQMPRSVTEAVTALRAPGDHWLASHS